MHHAHGKYNWHFVSVVLMPPDCVNCLQTVRVFSSGFPASKTTSFGLPHFSFRIGLFSIIYNNRQSMIKSLPIHRSELRTTRWRLAGSDHGAWTRIDR